MPILLWLLGMPLGVAVLLGAILAPTDPVLLLMFKCPIPVIRTVFVSASLARQASMTAPPSLS